MRPFAIAGLLSVLAAAASCGGSSPCGACGGGGQVACPHCTMGAGFAVCGGCNNGHGIMRHPPDGVSEADCGPCRKKADCEPCRGTGRVTCGACLGNKTVGCPDCGGTGRWPKPETIRLH